MKIYLDKGSVSCLKICFWPFVASWSIGTISTIIHCRYYFVVVVRNYKNYSELKFKLVLNSLLHSTFPFKTLHALSCIKTPKVKGYTNTMADFLEKIIWNILIKFINGFVQSYHNGFWGTMQRIRRQLKLDYAPIFSINSTQCWNECRIGIAR